ncbi:MAG: hypothetical protein HRU19_14005 [Pseudobacteriovorax sp.]|nr:hypothetical protein [Pseudobacteriovorax sp.]
MDLFQSNQKLETKVREFARIYQQNKQLAARFRELKRPKIGQIASKYRSQHKAHISTIRAYLDEEYQEFLNELINISTSRNKAKVEYETHKMLIQARQSLRLFRMVSQSNKKP